jgi:predicted kinase
MTYEKAVAALVDAKLLKPAQREAAVEVLNAHSVEFTYPDWAAALADSGLIDPEDSDKAERIMEEAGRLEEEEGGDEFDDALRNAGIF